MSSTITLTEQQCEDLAACVRIVSGNVEGMYGANELAKFSEHAGVTKYSEVMARLDELLRILT